jgi:hypothetical protein
MKVPDWMKLPLVALGLSVKEIEEYTPDNTGFTGSMAAPDRVGETIGILETLFAANLLNVDLPEGPVREGEAILVRGMLMRVERVQDRRLVLELPAGVKFRRPEDGRLIVQAPRKAG